MLFISACVDTFINQSRDLMLVLGSHMNMTYILLTLDFNLILYITYNEHFQNGCFGLYFLFSIRIRQKSTF